MAEEFEKKRYTYRVSCSCAKCDQNNTQKYSRGVQIARQPNEPEPTFFDKELISLKSTPEGFGLVLLRIMCQFGFRIQKIYWVGPVLVLQFSQPNQPELTHHIIFYLLFYNLS